MMKHILIGMFGIIMLISCASHKETTQVSKEKFTVTSPIIADTMFLQEYVAEIQSIKNVEIRSKIKGFLEKIYVDEGQSVQEGQVLFSISSSGLREELLKAQALLKSAQAEAKMAEVELKNTLQLVEKKVVSASELEMAKAKLEVIQAKIEEAHSNLANAQLNLSFAVIKAPFSGKINRIPLKTGSLVDEGSLLTTISDNSQVFAYFNVSEKEYLSFIDRNGPTEKEEVGLIIANGNLFPEKGLIETMESEIDKNTGNLAFRARFNNPKGILKHGASGKILLSKQLSKAMLIPQQSTFEVQENLYVYVINGDVVQIRKIVPQMRIGTMFVVQSGLTSSDKVLYEGIQLVKEGESIKPDFKKMNELVNHLKTP